MPKITLGSDLSIRCVESLVVLQNQTAQAGTMVWQPPERLWVTYAHFDVSEGLMPELCEALEAVAKALVPLQVQLGDWHWADGRRRCLGVEVDRSSDLLEGTYALLEKKLRTLGVVLPKRPFVPWVFLGRARGDASSLTLPPCPRFEPTEVDHFALFGEGPGARGPGRLQRRFYFTRPEKSSRHLR